MAMSREVCHTIARNMTSGSEHIDQPKIIIRLFSIGHLSRSLGNEQHWILERKASQILTGMDTRLYCYTCII